MAKGLIAGGTDYSHQTFKDILNDLKSERKNVQFLISGIENNLKIIEDNGYWKSKVYVDFRHIVAYSLQHYKNTVDELSDIVKELKREVKEHHCTRLHKIAKVAEQINIDIGSIWNADYDEHCVKEYGTPNFIIVEEIY